MKPIVQISLDLISIFEALKTSELALACGEDWLETGKVGGELAGVLKNMHQGKGVKAVSLPSERCSKCLEGES